MDHLGIGKRYGVTEDLSLQTQPRLRGAPDPNRQTSLLRPPRARRPSRPVRQRYLIKRGDGGPRP